MAGALGQSPAAALLATPEVRGQQRQQPNPMPATWPFGEEAWLRSETNRLTALDIRCGKRPAPAAPEQAATQAAWAAPSRPPAAASALPAALALPRQPSSAVPLPQASAQGLPVAAVVPMELDGSSSGLQGGRSQRARSMPHPGLGLPTSTPAPPSMSQWGAGVTPSLPHGGLSLQQQQFQQQLPPSFLKQL